MPEPTTPQPVLSGGDIEQLEMRTARSSYYDAAGFIPLTQFELDALIRDWRALQADLNFEEKWHNDHAEREAAVCPEDIPCDEYIRALEKQNTALREQLAETKKALVTAAIPYEAILLDSESRRWIAPAVWQAIESAVVEIRKTVKELKP